MQEEQLTIYQRFVDKNVKYGDYNSIDHQAIKKAKNFKMNRAAARKNLLDIKEIMDKHDIKFVLLYGTVLGAVREGNFIEHDTDTDTAIFEEDREKFINAIPDILAKGFVLFRTEEPDHVVSFIRDSEYLDVAILQKQEKHYTYLKCHAEEKFFDSLAKIEFLGVEFNVPNHTEEYLIKNYGKDWKTPRIGEHAFGVKRFNSFLIYKRRFVNYLRNNLLKTSFGQWLRKIKRKLQGLDNG